MDEKGTTVVFIDNIGIYFLGKVVDHSGRCPSCEDFWIYGGFEDYCVDCV